MKFIKLSLFLTLIGGVFTPVTGRAEMTQEQIIKEYGFYYKRAIFPEVKEQTGENGCTTMVRRLANSYFAYERDSEKRRLCVVKPKYRLKCFDAPRPFAESYAGVRDFNNKTFKIWREFPVDARSPIAQGRFVDDRLNTLVSFDMPLDGGDGTFSVKGFLKSDRPSDMEDPEAVEGIRTACEIKYKTKANYEESQWLHPNPINLSNSQKTSNSTSENVGIDRAPASAK